MITDICMTCTSWRFEVLQTHFVFFLVNHRVVLGRIWWWWEAFCGLKVDEIAWNHEMRRCCCIWLRFIDLILKIGCLSVVYRLWIMHVQQICVKLESLFSQFPGENFSWHFTCALFVYYSVIFLIKGQLQWAVFMFTLHKTISCYMFVLYVRHKSQTPHAWHWNWTQSAWMRVLPLPKHLAIQHFKLYINQCGPIIAGYTRNVLCKIILTQLMVRVIRKLFWGILSTYFLGSVD